MQQKMNFIWRTYIIACNVAYQAVYFLINGFIDLRNHEIIRSVGL